jgi:hypothetical protein
MPISIRALRPSHPAFAGEVSGIDITRPIDREDVAAIEGGWTRMPCSSFAAMT